MMRMNRKKVKAILFETVVIVLSIGMAACGNLEKEPEKIENNTENLILSTEEIDSTLAETLPENAEWNLLEHIETNNVMIQGRIETEDYPSLDIMWVLLKMMRLEKQFCLHQGHLFLLVAHLQM